MRAIPWYRSSWLPSKVDQVVYRIALTREVFVVNYLDSLSTVDVLRRLVPGKRCVPISAPGASDRPPGAVSDRLVADRQPRVDDPRPAGPCWACTRLSSRSWSSPGGGAAAPDLWIVVLPCLTILTLYSVAVPNLGALHRFRYGFS